MVFVNGRYLAQHPNIPNRLTLTFASPFDSGMRYIKNESVGRGHKIGGEEGHDDDDDDDDYDDAGRFRGRNTRTSAARDIRTSAARDMLLLNSYTPESLLASSSVASGLAVIFSLFHILGVVRRRIIREGYYAQLRAAQ
eukprot:1364201-Amorphochlora_amoeboformis.AAC.1